MNPLFETFIEVLVRSVLRGENITIRAQGKSAGHIWDVGRDRSYTQIIPDLLIETHSGVRLAIDAKYKRYDDYKLAQSDIYQTFLYAYAFRDPGGMMPSAILLYPSESRAMQITRLHIRDGQGNTQARLHSLGVDIPRALNGLSGTEDGGLFSHIREVIQGLIQQQRT
jgi:5-methylcytosine-specific restriction enzyme subunit McrC